MKQGDPKGMDDSEDIKRRGTGRTYRQLEKLSAGDVFLVHTIADKRLTERMLQDHFPGKGVMVQTTKDRHPDFLRGLRTGTWIEVDHHLWNMWETTQNDRLRAERTQYREVIHMTNLRSSRLNE